MRALFHKNFRKQYQKFHPSEKQRFKERRDIFLNDPFHAVLNNHALLGKYHGYRSINVTGDLRALYKLIGKDLALFVAIDRHSNLYR